MRLAVFTLLLTVLAAAPARAMRCGTRLIIEGDPQERVLRRCGEPADAWLRVEETTVLQNIGGALVRRRETVPVEVWVFNFGPSRAMERVEFRDGVVARIEHLGRGYRMSSRRRPFEVVRLHETRGQVRAKWGEPTRVTRRRQTSSVYVPSGVVAIGATRTVEVESWTYDFGPHRFARRVVFEDGLVVRVETLRSGG